MEKKNLDEAKKISAHFVSKNPYSISMWKVYHSLTLYMLDIFFWICSFNNRLSL